MLVELALVAAMTVENLSVKELTNYYWDCDTEFMKGELGGQDLLSCLAVTEELQRRVFNDDRSLFLKYWRRENLTEWYKRGFRPRVEDLPKYR